MANAVPRASYTARYWLSPGAVSVATALRTSVPAGPEGLRPRLLAAEVHDVLDQICLHHGSLFFEVGGLHVQHIHLNNSSASERKCNINGRDL